MVVSALSSSKQGSHGLGTQGSWSYLAHSQGGREQRMLVFTQFPAFCSVWTQAQGMGLPTFPAHRHVHRAVSQVTVLTSTVIREHSAGVFGDLMLPYCMAEEQDKVSLWTQKSHRWTHLQELTPIG